MLRDLLFGRTELVNRYMVGKRQQRDDICFLLEFLHAFNVKKGRPWNVISIEGRARACCEGNTPVEESK